MLKNAGNFVVEFRPNSSAKSSPQHADYWLDPRKVFTMGSDGSRYMVVGAQNGEDGANDVQAIIEKGVEAKLRYNYARHRKTRKPNCN